jgi:hypothetical protein
MAIQSGKPRVCRSRNHEETETTKKTLRTKPLTTKGTPTNIPGDLQANQAQKPRETAYQHDHTSKLVMIEQLRVCPDLSACLQTEMNQAC